VVRGLQLRGAGRYFLLSSVFWMLSISFLVGIPLHMSRYVPQWPTSVPFWVTVPRCCSRSTRRSGS